MRILGAVIAALVLTPFAARAQTYTNTEAYSNVVRPRVGVMGDVGVSRYDKSLAAPTEPGVAYGAHVELNPARPVTLEIGYRGALNDLNTRFSADGRLVTNEVGGNVRLNFVPMTYDLPGNLRPFVFGGIAYQHIGTENFTPGMSDANAVALPIGAGFDFAVANRIVVGARYTYNFLFNESHSFAGGDADYWDATVNVGAQVWP